MNRFILWTSICVVLLASCSDYSELDNPIGDAVGYNGVELAVKASYGKEATRTVVASNGTTIMWSPGDAINMFYGSGSAGKFTEQSLSGPATYAEFNGVLNVVTGSNETGTGARSFWGVYPYNEANTCDGSSVTMTIPSIQLPAENTFANGLNPSVATGLGLDLVFYNVGSWFIFTVESEGITSATLTGNNGEDLVGKVKVTMDSEGHPSAVIIDGEKSVTMNAPEGGFTPGVQYYMVILPQTLQQGYTLTLSKGDQTASFVNTNSSEFIRSWYRRKQKADSGLEFESSSDYVDLGLSVKWAKVNLGASSPEEFGDYYAWGETTPQSNGTYSWASYRWSAAGNSYSFTKYCSDYNYGNYYTVCDRNYVLDPQDDVASVKLGGNWRMPTDQEMDELLTNCTWTWDSSRSGYIVSSKVNNNSIFLPSAGRKYSNKIESGVGYYWTSSHESVYSSQQYYAQGLYFTSSSHTFSSSLKCNGLSVRPVYSDNDIPVSYVANYELNQIELTPGHYYMLRAYIYPEVATNQEVTWASSDESIATVSSDGKVTAVAEGNATITITSVDGGKTAYCQVLVTPDAVPDYVDLGLSVKWGTKNVGASFPENYGNHFSWGEITTKTDHSWSTYRFGSQSSLTKYSKTDGLVTLEPEDDAAYVNIGEDWRIPSSSEWKELTDNCTWTWEARNGTRGLRIVSKINGNSIFLPASGYQFNNRHLYSGRECFYWMSEVNTSNQSEALCRILSASVYSNVADGVSERKNGMSIRPIYDERPESVHVESITINQPTLSLELGSVGQLTTTILPTDVSNTNVTWTSSDLSVATVDAQGVVTAIGTGTASITVTTTDGGHTATCLVTVKKPFPAGTSFDPDAYITYVSNHQEWGNLSTEKDYMYDTQFSTNVSGTRIEMKFQIPDYSSGEAILSQGPDLGNGLAIDASNVYQVRFVRKHEDGDTWYNQAFDSGVGSGIDGTGVVVLTASCDGNQIVASVNGNETTIPVAVSSWSFNYLFSYYDYEGGDGSKYEYLAGVPDGAKLYYVKIWNGDDLVYFGHASRSVCSFSSEEEYCWYEEVGNKYTFARNLHTLASSEIIPYQPISPVVSVRQAFGGGID